MDYLNKLARGEISGSSSSDHDSDAESDDASDSSSDSSSDEDSGMEEDPLAVPGDHIEYAGDNDGSAEQIEDSYSVSVQTTIMYSSAQKENNGNLIKSLSVSIRKFFCVYFK